MLLSRGQCVTEDSVILRRGVECVTEERKV